MCMYISKLSTPAHQTNPISPVAIIRTTCLLFGDQFKHATFVFHVDPV